MQQRRDMEYILIETTGPSLLLLAAEILGTSILKAMFLVVTTVLQHRFGRPWASGSSPVDGCGAAQQRVP